MIGENMTPLKLADSSSSFGDPYVYTFKQGKYIITDGCHVLPDEVWQETIDFWDWELTDQGGHDWIMIEVNGHKICMFSTAYGDGCYNIIENSELYGTADVDSGSLAIIPREFDPVNISKVVKRGCGCLIQLDHECDLTSEERGIIQLGNFRVDTKNEFEEFLDNIDDINEVG